MTPAPNIVAVLVTYTPDIPALVASVTALRGQVDGLVLVDNGSDKDCVAAIQRALSDALGSLAFKAILQPENAGLGQAHNIGIAAARDMGAGGAGGAGAVLLMDQDSLPQGDMVQEQLTAWAHLRKIGAKPAAIGAHFVEPGRATPDPLPPGDDPVPEMTHVIASGTLIPLDVFAQVGPFEEGLFIDFVDTEWCFRARQAGYRCFAARRAKMQHQIGGAPMRILGRNMAVHSSERGYYQMRNSLLLLRNKAVPKGWAIKSIGYFVLRSLVLILCAPPRWRRAQMMAQGIWHGCLGITGKRP